MQTRSNRTPLVILISGRGSNLRSLVQAQAGGDMDCDIAGVISNRPEAAGLAWAAAQGIATRVVDHRTFADRARFDGALAEAVADMIPFGRPAWVVLAGFMRILGEAFISRYSGRIVNIHPSVLPLYPGLNTHRQALADGALLHGATVHLVTPKLDHGPIIAQAIVPVLAWDSESTLADRVLSMEHQLYPLAMQWLASDRIEIVGDRVLLDGADASNLRVLLHPLLGAGTPDAAAA